MFPTDFLDVERTFREIQSKIINLVHEYDLEKIPSDKEIREWLKHICNEVEDNKYILK